MYVAIRHKGYIWKVRKHPVESEEISQDRAWYIALNISPSVSPLERESLSRQWANEKYYQMKYQRKDETEQC